MKYFNRSLVLGCSLLALSACGPDDIASPGTNGDVTVNVNNSAPTPTPTPTPSSTLVTAAGACPTITDPQGLKDGGTISGPTGSYRICELPRVIKASSTLRKLPGVLYAMNGRVDVGCDGGFSAPGGGGGYASTTVGCGTITSDTNVTLTIEPGVVVFARTGQSWLAVNRGNKINAVGTATQPIVFTSSDNVAGFATDSTIGQWGGIVLLGRAKITDCDTGSVASNTCERDTEGAVDKALFGGNDDTYNAGSIDYIQVRYSGFVLSANKELQSLTLEGVGSGTSLQHFQSHNSSDDGAEFFGGNFHFKYYISTGADDDSLDVDTGARASLQYVLLIQRPGEGDALMEIDSNGNEADTPRTRLRVDNFTGIQTQVSANNEGADQASTLFRGNADVTLLNGVIYTPMNECIRMNGSGTTPATLTTRSVVMSCNATKYIGTGSYTAAQVQTMFGSGANGNDDSLTSTLTGLFVNGANEDGVATFAGSGVDSFFTETPTPYHIGAAWSGNTAWAAGWTCNSSYADLGGGGSCTSLPTN
ncbi:hypothetical protein [Croceibacterium salegens]|uniref:hypothetical protein n=1 Tax=Croceibacterium salegens TaxID=1737568 RepID=UPI000AD3304B